MKSRSEILDKENACGKIKRGENKMRHERFARVKKENLGVIKRIA